MGEAADIITSLDFNENSPLWKPYLPVSGSWIGERCGCTCHVIPGYWGRNEPAVCCGTLHQEVADEN